MSEYTQGIAFDGAAILKDGVPMTIDEIVATLNGAAQSQAKAQAGDPETNNAPHQEQSK